jgi:hypothetical protein
VLVWHGFCMKLHSKYKFVYCTNTFQKFLYENALNKQVVV